jgi:ribonuclease J
MNQQPNQEKPNRRPNGGGNQKNSPRKTNNDQSSPQRVVSRGAAIRAQKRNSEMANKLANEYLDASNMKLDRQANLIDDTPRLKIIGLGGMDGGGSKNMILLEYINDAIVIDAGNDLGVDLPGINYGIADTTYLESIKHKLRGYVITHGHLDHIGGLPHIVPKIPAPIYGSKFTIGRVEEIFNNFGLPMPEGFELKTVMMNEDTHEKLKVGAFFVELVRVTHSIPGSTCVIIDTPVGRVVNTGDFRFDPDPLDHERTDMDRLKEIGKEGVLVLLSESTTTERPGRTPSESTIAPSYVKILEQAPGRVFVAIFSTNINRIQMIIDAAVHHGRKIALDGRSMMSTLEMAVRHGFVKVPKGTFVPINSANSLPDDKVVVICTGGQGEPSSALMRMSTGDHRNIKMKPQDTVVLSSTPIPETGNDALIGSMVDDLLRKNVHVFQHTTRELDGCGPLHVSGHASREEFREMIDMMRPKFFVPIYGAFRSKQRHIDIAIEEGIPRKNTYNAENGDVLAFTKDKMEHLGQVPHGTVLVDQTGAIVSNVVIKDRLMMSQDGIVAVVLTVDRKTGSLLTSPDIISRGFIYMRDNEELMNNLRNELKRASQQRFRRVELDRFKQEIKEHVTHFLYENTQRSPIVIPVINVVGRGANNNAKSQDPKAAEQAAKDEAALQSRRFAQLRQQLLGQDPRTD